VWTGDSAGVMLAPVPGVLLSAVLAAQGVSFVLVGSAALWVRGEVIPVGDTDAVIEPGQANLGRLHAALTSLAVRPQRVPAVSRLGELPVVSVMTSYGSLDSLLERGRLDWNRLRAGSELIGVIDVGVRVASARDAWALRRRFKG
jgi:hypothetical protein